MGKAISASSTRLSTGWVASSRHRSSTDSGEHYSCLIDEFIKR